MDRTAALEQIRAARVARGVSYDDLGKAIGTKDPTYLAAALHGQHRLSADEAKSLAAAVGVPVETAMATTAMPLRIEFPLTTDPFKYRLMELVGVYREALALLERPLLAHVLALTGGNQLRAARILGLNRNTLRKRCRELSLPATRVVRRPRVSASASPGG